MASGAVRSKAVAMSLFIHCLLSLQLLWGFKQGDSNSEIIICFILNLSYNQILQLMRVITVLGFTITSLPKTICGIVGHCFVLQYFVSFIVLQSSAGVRESWLLYLSCVLNVMPLSLFFHCS